MDCGQKKCPTSTRDVNILQETEQNTQAIVKEQTPCFSGISRAPGQIALDIGQMLSSLARLALVLNDELSQMMENLAYSSQRFLAILHKHF